MHSLSHAMPIAQAVAEAQPPSVWAVIGFLVLLGLLLVILFRGAPNIMPEVGSGHPPRTWTGKPVETARRKRAAAAAYILHRHRHHGETP